MIINDEDIIKICKQILSKPLTQQALCLAQFIEKGKTSTRELSVEPFYFNCPPAVIRDLRKKGLNIVSKEVQVTNQFGRLTTYMEYSLDIPQSYKQATQGILKDLINQKRQNQSVSYEKAEPPKVQEDVKNLISEWDKIRQQAQQKKVAYYNV